MGARSHSRQRLLAASALIASLTLAGCTGPDGASGPGTDATNANLTAATGGVGSFDLVELDLDGQEVAHHQVPTGIGFGYRISPDGRTAAWIDASSPEGPTLSTLDLATGATTTLPTVASAMDWLPDGRMVGVDLSTPPGSIGLLDAAGQFTPTGRLPSAAVAPRRFSNTEVLLFERADSSDQSVAGGQPVIVSLDGTEYTRLSLPDGCFAAGASASPDHTKVAVAAVCAMADDNGLYLISSDGEQRVRLVDSGVVNPAWSPDGRTIAYLGNSNLAGADEPLFGASDIMASTVWAADAATGQTRRITSEDSHYVAPNWRPLQR